jgi:magnesium transporter
MLVPSLTHDQLHDPILPHVRPAPLVLKTTETVGHALQRTRALPAHESLMYSYVVDDHNRLHGYVPIRTLLRNPVDASIADVMVTDVLAIPSWATVLVAAEYFVNRRLRAFPVVQPDGELVGVVDVVVFNDDVLALARQSFEGIYQIIGVHATAGLTAWSSFKDRFPWLLCNVGGGLLCAILSSRYQALLNVAVVLALFIPVVLALAESVSIQSVTLTLQNLHSGKPQWGALLRGLGKEAAIATMLGVCCGGLIGGVAWIWKGQEAVAAVLGGAIVISMVTACLIGVALPTAVRALKVDPKIAAGPIVLALADLLTLMFYFTIAGKML